MTRLELCAMLTPSNKRSTQMLGMSALFLIVGVALNLFMPTYIPTLICFVLCGLFLVGHLRNDHFGDW